MTTSACRTDSVRNWAFAHYGGRFYLFVTEVSGVFTIDIRNRVYEVDPVTRKTRRLQANAPYAITGAGVSTCVPYGTSSWSPRQR